MREVRRWEYQDEQGGVGGRHMERNDIERVNSQKINGREP